MKRLMGVVLLLGLIQSVQAGVVLSTTRVIFPGNEKSAQVVLNNTDANAYLVQAAVLDDKETVSRDFAVVPPLFRLEGKGSNVVRIVRTGGDLPVDRESVRYFVERAIAASDKPFEAKGSALSIALATQIKLFYRPQGLRPQVDRSYGLLTATQRGGEVVVSNPTPYYQTFAQLLFDGKERDFSKQPQMVAPFGQVRYAVEGKVSQWSWSCINDFGAQSQTYRQAVK